MVTKESIFLQKFNSKTSSNTSKGINVELKGKRKLLPLDDVSDVISQYDQYSDERKSCNIIRLTCQVNTVCSNILFNKISEIVKNEGSSDITFINYGVGDNEFNGISFKNKEMSFWSGNTFTYSSATVNADTPSFSSFQLTEEDVTHPTNSIRDMQLSKLDVGFVYHCGLDVFNNHLIRSNTFKTICKTKEETSDAFNTVADFMRDVKGDYITENIYFPVDSNLDTKSIYLHLYKYDDIDTFEEAIDKKLVVKHNGWVGFNNRSKIKSYSSFTDNVELDVERPIMYMNGGDFVDMYPTRDLFSFVPKYNKYRNRIEKNWNYCITYPSSSYTPSNSADPFTEIFELGNNSLKAVYFDENTFADNGTKQIVIYGVSKHGLAKGDHVNIYNTYETQKFWVVDTSGNRISSKYNTLEEANAQLERMKTEMELSCGDFLDVEISDTIYSGETELYTDLVVEDAEVTNIVDDYIFTVFNPSIQISKNWYTLKKDDFTNKSFSVDGKTYKIDDSFKFATLLNEDNIPSDTIYYIVNESYVNIDSNAQNISYKKVVNGIECDYYVRIFSKLPNFKYASGDTSNEMALYANDGEVIREYQDKKYDFGSQVSKLAFSKNVYNDEIGEIVFTDDIDISNLHDNLGRPLTSLYLTVIKNNKGYKEWYGYDYDNWEENDINLETVEYSHAFGKVTCGIETSYESNIGTSINSINRISNVANDNNGLPMGFMVDGILNDKSDGNPRSYTVGGKTIEIGSNEIWYDADINFYGDLCCYDSYNLIETPISPIMHRFNTAQRESINSKSEKYFKNYIYDEIYSDDYDMNPFSITSYTSNNTCYDKPEGYYYNPHYEIPIKTFDRLQTLMPDFLGIREMMQIGDGTSTTYRFTTFEKHYLDIGDKAVLYDKLQDKYYNLTAISGVNDNYKVFTCNVFDDKTNEPCAITTENGNPINKLSSRKNIGSVTVYDFTLFKMDNLDCPSYAKILKDGTCRIIWRNVLNNGFGETNAQIEEYPFTNGAFYVNKPINLYVKRQDPQDYYGIYSEDDIEGLETEIFEEDNYVKEIDIEC